VVIDLNTVILASSLFLVIAFLYSSVGHAGASGYLAVMSLLSFAPESIKPISLVLNCVVAAIASYKFISLGYFDRRIFTLFICSSVPFAFLGGWMQLPPNYFKLFAGIFLIVSALLLLFKSKLSKQQKEIKINQLSIPLGVLIGAVIGFFSGLIGVGGGIFLSPILILMGWATIKNTSGISALFILLNSMAGLIGYYNFMKELDSSVFVFMIVVAIGGFLGAHFGSKKLSPYWITLFLVLVLFSAGVKFVFSL
jgi:uncharacterized protein